MTIEPTLGLEAAFRQSWQAVVIGAGPAGAVAARGLARRGLQVLLIDRKRFPRWKTCGGCLNERALSVLRELGLEKTLDELGAVPLHEFRLVTSGRQVTLPLPGGRALSRTRFDAALVQAAIDAGAHFLPETRGEVRQAVEGHRLVELRQGGDSAVVSARVVIVADGLGSRSLANSPEFRCQSHENSRIGVGGMTREFPPDYRENTIFMAVGQGGYVGLVRLEEGSLNLAAALDKQTIKKSGSVGKTLAALLEEAGLPEVPAVDEFAWHGTVELTRQTLPPAAERVFVLGDAAGYAEPFTGEGMSWALESAQAVVPLSLQAAEGWKPEFPREWAEITRKIVGRRQQFCRKLSAALRFPWLVRGGVGLLSCFPSLASPLIRTLNASPSPREMEHS